METVKLILASFDYPIYTVDDKGMQYHGLPKGIELPKDLEEEAELIQKTYDSMFDTSGDFTKFVGFEKEEDKDKLETLSKDLAKKIRKILPEIYPLINTIPETLLLAPLKKTIDDNDERGKESLKGNPFRPGGDCE